MSSRPDIPTGTVTFLFTDIEGSTRLWEEHPEAMRDALALHDDILRTAVEEHDGLVVKTTGDGLHAAFTTAHDAVHAAAAAQRALGAEPWEYTGPLLVRMGVHTGEAEQREGDYYGTAVNRAARLMSTAHGGQVLVSQVTAGLLSDAPVDGIGLLDLGAHRLRDLARAEHLYQLVAPGLVESFPLPRTLDAFPTNLPIQPTSFLGRSRELAEVADLLHAYPLVTLTGVGGVGKTRLALQVAADSLPRFPDGAWLVELAPIADPDAVAQTIAAVLGVPPETGSTIERVLVDDLRRRALLLVLDNCEHVLDRVALLADEIVRHCPEVTVLATSREGLAVAGERIVAVPSLTVPESDSSVDAAVENDAVRLFVDRARAVRADFTLSADDVDDVVAICRRLDGVPLAIELAAARVVSLAPAQIAERLDERFRLLGTGRRATVERHQTLRAAIDWSYDLLTLEEQTALNRLSVFAGGCDLEAAEAVVGGDGIDAFDVIDLLTRLVQQSLVVADTAGAEPRYRLLETIRQYAAEQLVRHGDGNRTHQRHADHFREVAHRIGLGLLGSDESIWLRRHSAELENLRTALEWLVDRDDTYAAYALVTDLHPLAFDTGSDDIVHIGALAALALEAPPDPADPRYPFLLAVAAEFRLQEGDLDGGRALMRRIEAESQVRADGEPLAKFALLRSMILAGDIDSAVTLADSLLDGPDLTEGSQVAVRTLVTVAASLALADDRQRGRRLALEAVALAGSTNPTTIGMALVVAGWMIRRDEPEAARSMFEEARTVAERGNRNQLVYAWANLFALDAQADNRDQCLVTGREAVRALARVRERNAICATYANLAEGFAALGRFEIAAVLHGAAEAMSPSALAPGFRLVRVRDDATTEFGADRFEALREGGRDLDKDAVIELLIAELDAMETDLAGDDRSHHDEGGTTP